MTKVVSSSALATLTAPAAVLKKDTLLHLIAKLASPLQLKLVETKKGDLSLQLENGTSLAQRNAILRALCGSALLYALDQSPLLLLGGHSGKAIASPTSALAMAGITSYMSVADSVRTNMATEQDLVEGLDTHLKGNAFLVSCAHATLADMDLTLALLETKVEVYANNVQRWMSQVHAVMVQLGNQCGVDIPVYESTSTMMDAPMPVFYYGLEEFVPPATGNKKAKTSTTTPAAAVSQQVKDAAADKSAKTKKTKAKQPPQPTTTSTPEIDISALDIRVGKILKAWHHETADKLFCEEVDVGEDQPRQIASGLRAFYQTQDLQDRKVLVLCNLKARNLVGFPSHGMVLCASNDDHTKVEFVDPPASAKIGERVAFKGVEQKDPEAENKVAKKKLFEKLAPDLKTNAEGAVVWKDFCAMTVEGPVTCGMPNAHVS